MKPQVKPRRKRQLSPERLAKREALFELYRDLGPGRSYEQLIELARPQHGPISKRTLVNWSRAHNWRARLDEHDRRLASASQAQLDGLDPDFDMVEALKRIARSAIYRVSVSHVEVRTPQDAKVMIEVAERAQKLAAELYAADGGEQRKAERQQNVRELFKLVDEMTRARFAAEGTPVAHHRGADERDLDDVTTSSGGGEAVH